MPYKASDLQPGDILLITASRGSLLDSLIKWSTDSPYVHAAIVGDGCIIEGLWKVTESPLNKYEGNGWAFSVPGSTAEQRNAAVKWATSRVGRHYGVLEILLDGARFDLHWLPRHPIVPRRLTCSALVASAYLASGFRLTWAPFPAPADLAASPLLSGRRLW